MTVNWNEPLELTDGTPVARAFADKCFPDKAGDYALSREDGERFSVEQAGDNLRCIAYWRADGTIYANFPDSPGLSVRNRVVDDTPPDWACVRAWDIMWPEGNGMSAVAKILTMQNTRRYANLARYIAKTETPPPPPIDPDVLEAREYEAKRSEDRGYLADAAEYRKGKYDRTIRVASRLEGIKRGRELAGEGK